MPIVARFRDLPVARRVRLGLVIGAAALLVPGMFSVAMIVLRGRYSPTPGHHMEVDWFLLAPGYPAVGALIGAVFGFFAPWVRRPWHAAALGGLVMSSGYALMSVAAEPRGAMPYHISWPLVGLGVVSGSLGGVIFYWKYVRRRAGRSEPAPPAA